MNSKNNVLITGATGLIGSFLVMLFLERGHKVYALARRVDNLSAVKRVDRAISFWKQNFDFQSHRKQLVVIEGDLSAVWRIKDFIKKVDSSLEIIHCAAITSLGSSQRYTEKINVSGLKKILELALFLEKAKKFRKLVYISTAYVCGDYRGFFNESKLDLRQRFSTFYAESKFKAEKLIDWYQKKYNLWIDVIRMPIVVGEERTGKIPSFNNIYQIFRLCKFGLFDALPFKQKKVDLVPVDYVANLIYLIVKNNNAWNRRFHIFSRESFRLEKLLNLASKVLGFKKPRFVAWSSGYLKTLSPAKQRIINAISIILDTKAKFGFSNTNSFLKRYNSSIRRLDKTFLLKQVQYFKEREYGHS